MNNYFARKLTLALHERYIMALVDTLDYFPEHHPGRERLLSYLQSLADAVVASQDKLYKGWYNIMDPGLESRSGNYIESSGSAMFVYGLFKALRLGYISGEQYEAAATSGWDLMTGTFAEKREPDGALVWGWTVQTGSLSSNGTFEVSPSADFRTIWEEKPLTPKQYYASIPLFENDLKGVAPFIFSAYEYELYVEGKE